MLRQILFLLCFFIFTYSIFGQTEKTIAPAKWERYWIEEYSVSVLFPKLPVIYEDYDVCRSEVAHRYGTYHNGNAYIFAAINEFKEDQSDCSVKKQFDQQNFFDRLKQAKEELKEIVSESTEKKNNFDVIKLIGKQKVYWFFNDSKNKRWFEFWIVGQNELTKESINFLNSLKLDKKATGIKIGEGSPFTIGDEKVPESSDKSPANRNLNPDNNSKLRIVLQARGKYTEEARKNMASGQVFLKVTFGSNGSVLAVAPVKSLPYGLTEQAIAAAKKLLFLPEIRNGMRVTITRTVVYNFILVE